VIQAAGVLNLGVVAEVDALDKALTITDMAEREAIWPQIDRRHGDARAAGHLGARTALPAAQPAQCVRRDGFQMYDYDLGVELAPWSATSSGGSSPPCCCSSWSAW
jgi:hypothetical protein